MKLVPGKYTLGVLASFNSGSNLLNTGLTNFHSAGCMDAHGLRHFIPVANSPGTDSGFDYIVLRANGLIGIGNEAANVGR